MTEPTDTLDHGDVGADTTARRRSGTRWLPIALAVAVLLALNVGIHTRLSASSADDIPNPVSADASATPDSSEEIDDGPSTIAPVEVTAATAPLDASNVTAAGLGDVIVAAGPGDVIVAAVPSLVSAPLGAVPVGTVPLRTSATTTTAAVPVRIDFDGADERGWNALGGTWARIDGRLIQDQASGFDLSLIREDPTGYPMAWRTTFQHLDGAGAGLLFDLPSADRLAGGQLVRFMGDGTAVAWGAFDAEGVFVGQGGTTVPDTGSAAHELVVRSDGRTYDVLLDGQELAAGVPLAAPSPQHHVGLTTSETRAAFDDAVLELGDRPASTGVDSPIGAADEALRTVALSATSGDWQVVGETVRQSDPGFVDHVADLGLSAPGFEMAVDIDLLRDQAGDLDKGAGIIFGMQGEGDRRGAYMVRFAGNGDELFWGRFDDEGVFRGEGGVPLPADAGEPLRLELRHDGASLDVTANGAAVARGIPVGPTAGRLGLISFSGPVVFSDLAVEVPA